MKTRQEKRIKEQQKLSKEKREFKIALIIVIVIVAILLSTLFLPDLIKEWKYKASLVKLTAKDSYLLDEDGNKYYTLNRSVEAVNTDGVFGLLDGKEFCFIDFMHTDGVLPSYIVEHTNGIKGSVLRLESASDITLSDFSPVSADICTKDSEYPYDYFVAPDEYLNNGGSSRNDEEYINLIYDALTKGEEVNPPKQQVSSLRVKLKSQKYPGLYYSIAFSTDENGISYLCDIGSGKYVLSPDKLTVRLS
jgi:competence protein ComGC